MAGGSDGELGVPLFPPMLFCAAIILGLTPVLFGSPPLLPPPPHSICWNLATLPDLISSFGDQGEPLLAGSLLLPPPPTPLLALPLLLLALLLSKLDGDGSGGFRLRSAAGSGDDCMLIFSGGLLLLVLR